MTHGVPHALGRYAMRRYMLERYAVGRYVAGCIRRQGHLYMAGKQRLADNGWQTTAGRQRGRLNKSSLDRPTGRRSGLVLELNRHNPTIWINQ